MNDPQYVGFLSDIRHSVYILVNIWVLSTSLMDSLTNDDGNFDKFDALMTLSTLSIRFLLKPYHNPMMIPK